MRAVRRAGLPGLQKTCRGEGRMLLPPVCARRFSMLRVCAGNGGRRGEEMFMRRESL